MKHGLVDITDFLPPLDDGDDPREDDDFADLVAEIRDGKIEPPAPIRVLVAQDGVRLADRPAWKLWAACRGKGSTQSIGLLPKRCIQVVKADEGENDEQQLVDEANESQPTPLSVNDSRPMRQQERRRVKLADLRPNHINSEVFTTSLSADGIEPLKESLGKMGLRHEIEVTEDLTILDGERRSRGLIANGVEETEVVIVHGVHTPEDIEQYVLESHSTQRDASIEERVNLYGLAQRVLARDHGRPRGRPSGKRSSNDDLFWSASKIRAEAAKRAGFGSDVTASRAVAVFQNASEDVKEKLVAGDLTVGAAYKTIKKSKASRKKGKDRGDKTETKTKASKSTKQTSKEDTHTDQADTDEEKQDTKGSEHQAEGEQRANPQDPDAGETHAGEERAEETGRREDPGESDADNSGASSQEGGGTNTQEPGPTTLKAALQVIADFASKGSADKVRKMLEVLGTRAALMFWIQPEDVKDGLDDLGWIVCGQVDLLAGVDSEAAREWVTGLHGDLHEVLSQHDTDDVDKSLDA